MSTHRAWLQVAIIAAILTAGCTPRIHIVRPDAGKPYEPVPAVVATFESDFNPAEAWHIDLDGTNLTGFSPLPAPGGTSSTSIDVNTLSVGFHTIKAQATCGTFCVYQSEEVTFLPPALRYNTTTYVSVPQNLKQFLAAPVWVGVQNFRSVPINVTIVETSTPKRVKLASTSGAFQPPGTPITVTIPASNTRADFFIEGDVLGTYILSFTAPGVVSGGGSGNVAP